MPTVPPTLPFHRPDPNAPPPEYARLRAEAPVAAVATPDGRTAWLVTSYETVTAVLSDPRFGMTPPGPVPPENNTLFQDGEPHARLRRLVAKAFTARNITAQRPRIERLAAEHAEALAKTGAPADLVTGFAAPLSITAIGEILGVAVDRRERFRQLADTVAAQEFSFDEAAAAEAVRAWHELGEHIGKLIARKRDRLGDDLLSAMIAVRDAADGRLDDGELVAMATTVISAGYTTTRNAICAAVVHLTANGRLGTVTDDPDSVPALVEELLRHQSGQIAEPLPRWAHTDVTLAGAGVAAGDMVLVRTEAANRDPAVFAEPDGFEPARERRPHVTFGRGAHHCLGAALARVELGAALTALARRLPELRLSDPATAVDWRRGSGIGGDIGLDRLDVTW